MPCIRFAMARPQGLPSESSPCVPAPLSPKPPLTQEHLATARPIRADFLAIFTPLPDLPDTLTLACQVNLPRRLTDSFREFFRPVRAACRPRGGATFTRPASDARAAPHCTRTRGDMLLGPRQKNEPGRRPGEGGAGPAVVSS